MGVDLKLLPVECDHGTWGFAHSMLEIGGQYKLFDKIEKLTAIERPDFNFSSFVSSGPDGYCYGTVKETPYGKPLAYVRRVDLVDAMQQIQPKDLGERANAAMHYLIHVSCEWVGLYWH